MGRTRHSAVSADVLYTGLCSVGRCRPHTHTHTHTHTHKHTHTGRARSVPEHAAVSADVLACLLPLHAQALLVSFCFVFFLPAYALRIHFCLVLRKSLYLCSSLSACHVGAGVPCALANSSQMFLYSVWIAITIACEGPPAILALPGLGVARLTDNDNPSPRKIV